MKTINEEPVVYHWKYKMDEIDGMVASVEPQALMKGID